MTPDSSRRNHFAENRQRERVVRPAYDPRHELYLDALELVTDLAVQHATAGNVAAWALFRCWAEVVLAWWSEAPR